MIRYLVRQRIAAGRPVTYVDATHLTPWERKPYVILAQRYGCRLEALFFDVPVEVCIARNQARDRVVPEAAIRKMALQMIPPSREEGFTEITGCGYLGRRSLEGEHQALQPQVDRHVPYISSSCPQVAP